MLTKINDFGMLEKFLKAKGHTKIELRDVRTGEKKIIEHDNTFQASVLENYMRGMGIFNNYPFTNATWAARDFWKNIVGGVYLFRDAIASNTRYMPNTNLMIANACVDVTSSEISELGSFDEQETELNSSGLTIVYNWGTSQGNGTISSVCLGSDVGGYIGYSNSQGVATTTKKKQNLNQNSNSLSGLPYNNYMYSFAVDDTNKVLTVNKTRSCITYGSVLDGATETETYSYNTNIKFIGSSSIVVSSYCGSGKFIIMLLSGGSDLGAGANLSFLIYDADNKTASVSTITNNSGGQLRLMYNSAAYFGVDASYIYLARPSTNVNARTMAPIYRFSLSGAQTYDTFYLNGVTLNSVNGVNHFSPGFMSFANYILNTNTGLEYPSNLDEDKLSYNDNLDALVTKAFNSNAVGVIQCFKNPLYLATINNLETAVEKNSNQTMKLIYTLTEGTT